MRRHLHTHTQRCKVVTEEIHTFHIAQFSFLSFLNLHESPSCLLPRADRAMGTATEPAEDLGSSRSPPRCFDGIKRKPASRCFVSGCLFGVYILFNPAFVLIRVSFPAASPVRPFLQGETRREVMRSPTSLVFHVALSRQSSYRLTWPLMQSESRTMLRRVSQSS